MSVLPRSAVPEALTWDVSRTFVTRGAWDAACQQVLAQLPVVAAARGTLTSAVAVAAFLADSLALANLAERLVVYAQARHDVDTADAAMAADYDQALGIAAQLAAALAFARPELLALPDATIAGWLADEPALAPYARYFAELARRRPHVRSADVEALLGMLGAPFSSAARIHGTITDADLWFAPARDAAGQTWDVTQGTISALLAHPDREVRRTAWEHYADAHLAVRHGLAGCLATGVKQQVMLARARNYPSAIEASLAAADVPLSVFDALIDAFRAHLPVWHRYWDVRRRALGVERLHGYDVKAPLVDAPLRVPYATAVEWICRGLAPLGAEYVAVARRGLLEERWVDVVPNQGKRMGAYSMGVPGTPPYIFMSYNDDIFSVSTLAHEIGHSMHSYLTWQQQPLAYCDYTLFVAEVASNLNQALVRAALLAADDTPSFQIQVIEEAMANFYRYLFVMPTLARFERQIHEQVERGAALTAQSLTTLMAELFAEAFGPAVEIDVERIGSTWAQFSTHLYANFYVYQYATGISAAHALAAPMLRGDAAAVARYLAFLGSGSSLPPIEALRRAGVDMLSPEPVASAFATLAALIERLEALVAAR
jgi:oligoendopeptidase F